MHPRANGLVTLLTDFGSTDPYVGIMKGAIKRRFARAELIDICHEVPAHDVQTGAFYWSALLGRFPAGTVHVGVVDPGVGGSRRMLAAYAAECYWVGPDNGMFEGLLAEGAATELRVIECARLGLAIESRTFHGRDVFGPAAGMMASGKFGFPAIGARVDSATATRQSVFGTGDEGRILTVDHFGNLLTTLRAAPDVVALELAGRTVSVHGTYGDVERGELLALESSFGLFEIAAREARACDILAVGRGHPVRILRAARA